MHKAMVAFASSLVLGMAGLMLHKQWQVTHRPVSPAQVAGQPVATISHGQCVDLEPFVAAEGLTVFEFYADYCLGCRQLAPQLAAVAHARPDVKVRVVDVQTLRSPVARQHGIDRLPTVWLYENGKLLGKETPVVMARLLTPK